MHQQPGKVVFRSSGADGIFEVVDHGPLRSLYFGTRAAQSTMDLLAPERLVLPYTRAMMSCLLFWRRPRNALMVGLGGGSLARFLLHHYPECQLDAVESQPRVPEIARLYFALPSDPRLRVHIADGGTQVREHTAAASYDLLLVDAYDGAGMADAVTGEAFYAACRRSLADGGVLVTNLWNSLRAPFRASVGALDAAFDQAVMLLPVLRNGNTVALAFATPPPRKPWQTLRKPARDLNERLDVDLPHWLQVLRRSNGGLLERWL